MGKSLSTIHSFHLYFGALFLKGEGGGAAMEEEFPFSFPYLRGPTDVEKMYCLIICIWNKQTKKSAENWIPIYFMGSRNGMQKTRCSRWIGVFSTLVFYVFQLSFINKNKWIYWDFKIFSISIRGKRYFVIWITRYNSVGWEIGSPKCKFKEKKTIKI